jgi:hypothetical protein
MTINGFDIELPIGLKQVLDTPVRDSYQDFLQKDASLVRRHLTALTTMLPKYIGAPNRVLHVFGGVGATAQLIDQCAEGVHHTFWERDPVLVEYLKTKYDDVHLVEDSYAKFILNDPILRSYDAIMFDPSVGTIKTPHMKQCWKVLHDVYPDTIWLSDTACAKIHLNAKFYETDFGMPVYPTAEVYMDTYDLWLRKHFGLCFKAAMREAAEMYAVIQPSFGAVDLPHPIPYM